MRDVQTLLLSISYCKFVRQFGNQYALESEGNRAIVIYSPSQTETFQRCPRLWWYRYPRRLESNWIGYPTIARLTGRAIDEGLSEYYRHGRTKEAMKDGQLRAETIITDQYRQWKQSGYSFNEWVPTDEILLARVNKALTSYSAHDPFAAHEIELVQPTLGRWGDARPDLVVNTPLGRAFVDHKTTLNLHRIAGKTIEMQVAEKVEEFAASNQALHYAAGLGVWRGYHNLLVLEPNLVIHCTLFTISPPKLEQWEHSMRYWWPQVKVAEAFQEYPQCHPMNLSSCRTRYGLCEFYSLCHHHYGNVEAGCQKEYSQRPRPTLLSDCRPEGPQPIDKALTKEDKDLS